MHRRTLLASLPFFSLASAAVARHKIANVQTMTLLGGRTYILVKITADNGVYGIAEAYGTPGYGVKEQILSLKPWLIGKDPLETDKIFTLLGQGASSLSGSRTDGSAHNFLRAASAIDNFGECLRSKGREGGDDLPNFSELLDALEHDLDLAGPWLR